MQRYKMCHKPLMHSPTALLIVSEEEVLQQDVLHAYVINKHVAG